MSVSAHDSHGVHRLDVLGTLETRETQQELLVELGHTSGKRCEVTFYDARTLPGEIVERLAELDAACAGLRIFAYHGYLTHFLMRLGLPVTAVQSHPPLQETQSVRAIVMGGSADSLDKILRLTEALPPGEVAVFVVQHVPEEQENLLDRLLKVRTEYTVVMPQHLMAIEPGTIYVAPGGHHMKIANGQVYLTRDKKVQFARPSIDVLFESVAREYNAQAIGVLLCGYGRDGVAATHTLKAGGATVIIENSDECGARDLTEAGRLNGAYDHILGVKEIACYLAASINGRTATPDEHLIGLFLAAVSERYGYDFSNYQRGTVGRRLDRLLKLMSLPDFFTLQREVLTDGEAFEHLFLELSINVTSFFRHPQQFRRLREEILPYLDSFPHINIWSAGCATGEEAYSLAILLDELGMLEKTRIFATDINPYVLEQAKSGLFPTERLEEERQNYRASGGGQTLDSYFINHGAYWKIDPRLRKNLLFHRHSLTGDGVFNEFQLILCRNVVIYFNPTLQQRVMDLFARSLHPDGFLIMGTSESLSVGEGERHFKPHSAEDKIFRKR